MKKIQIFNLYVKHVVKVTSACYLDMHEQILKICQHPTQNLTCIFVKHAEIKLLVNAERLKINLAQMLGVARKNTVQIDFFLLICFL